MIRKGILLGAVGVLLAGMCLAQKASDVPKPEGQKADEQKASEPKASPKPDGKSKSVDKSKEKPKKGSSEVRITVVRASNEKPIRNAAIILHGVNKDGKQEKEGWESKTNHEGQMVFPGIPFGKMRLQIIAQGFRTYGEDFDIDQPVKEIVVKLERPKKQVSIYE